MLDKPIGLVIIINMAKAKQAATMTELLRQALREVDSIRAVALATGLEHASLTRFVNEQQSLRLDLGDRLAAHFEIESRRTTRKR